MRKPQPERFDPNHKSPKNQKRKPDEINTSGIIPLKPKSLSNRVAQEEVVFTNAPSNNITVQTQKKQLADCNITILQFTEDDLASLREPSYKAHTYRFTPEEVTWVRKTAYDLSNDLSSGKVTQGDILRISIRLFKAVLKNNKDDVLTLLKKIK